MSDTSTSSTGAIGGANPPTISSGSNDSTGTGLTFAQVENYWIQAGGNPQAAAMAAAVADASSGLDAAATRTNPDGTISIGLWLLPKNGSPPGSTDPLANARAAIQLSQNGTDWTQWCVTWSDNNCGENNGTYLGEGSNALASLGQKLSPSSYNVIGSTPSGSGTGASAATSTSTTTGQTTSSSSSKIILLVGGIVLIVIIVYFVRKNREQGLTPQPVSETDVTTND